MLKRLTLIFALVIGFFSVDDSWAFPFGEGVFGYSILGDSDNDLVPDSADQFPDDSSETKDSDSDGIGDNKDLDDDNDGVEDINDGFPFIPLGGLSDADADGFPEEPNESFFRDFSLCSLVEHHSSGGRKRGGRSENIRRRGGCRGRRF